MPDIGMDNEMKATLETNNEWEHTKQEQDSGTDSRLIGKVARERIKQGYGNDSSAIDWQSDHKR